MDSKQHSNAIGAFGLQARILGIDGKQYSLTSQGS